MATTSTTATHPAAATAPSAVARAAGEQSYVDWAAILGGAILAAAISFVLITFGTGLGLSMVSLEPGEGVSLRWATIAAGIWFIWVVVSSYAAGGYLAGRMRRRIGDATADEVETRDGAHGLLVWATGALFATLMAVSGAGGMLASVSSATGAAAGSASELASEQMDYFAGRMLRSEGALASPEAREEIVIVLGRSLTEGEVSAEDRDYLAQVVASETNLAPEDARAQIDQVISDAEAVRDEAIEAAEQARIAGVIGAFVLAATMLVGAAAAYFAATTGGQHRDQNISFRYFGRRV